MNKIVWLLVLISWQIAAQTRLDEREHSFRVDTLGEQDSVPPCVKCVQSYLRHTNSVSPHLTVNLLRGAICAFQCGDTARLSYFLERAAMINWGECLAIWNAVRMYPEHLAEFVAVKGTDFEKLVCAKAKSVAIEQGINFGLYMELDVIQREDQRYRLLYDSISKNYPVDGPVYKAFIKEMRESDAARLNRLEQIFEQYGYPGKTLVGRYSDVAWLVIQHSPLEVQEKYLPMLTEATEKGELHESNWAMLIDRMRFNKGQPQLYGSQVVRDPRTGQRAFHPIEDEANVNKRRADMGLMPLEEYAKSFGFEWKPK